MSHTPDMAIQFECEDCHLMFPTIHQLDYHKRHACWFTCYNFDQCMEPLGCDCKSKADREDVLDLMKNLSLQSNSTVCPSNIS